MISKLLMNVSIIIARFRFFGAVKCKKNHFIFEKPKILNWQKYQKSSNKFNCPSTINGLTNMNLNCVGLSSNWNFCCQIALPSFLFLFVLWSCFSPSVFKAWEISLSSCCLFSSFIPVTVQGGFEQTTLKLFVLGQWLLQRWLNDRFQH